MNAWPLPNTCPTCDRMARVSVCRAACGRRAVELFSRCKNWLNSGTRHQTSPRLNDGGRYQKRVSQLSQLQRARLGQKNPMKSMLSQLSRLSQSKNTPPEADTTTKPARRPWFLGWLAPLVLKIRRYSQGYPGRGWVRRRAPAISSPAPRGYEAWPRAGLGAPPVMGPFGQFHMRVIRTAQSNCCMMLPKGVK